MSFQWPAALFGLALIPLLLLSYLFLQRRRHRYAVRFTNLDLLANLVEQSPGWRRHIPPVLTLVALAATIIALARPEATITTARNQATVVLATDTSGSMGAFDVYPSRLVAAQKSALLLIDQLPEEIQVALVQFSTEARVLTPATSDHVLLEEAIGSLRAEGRTALGDAIAFSVETGLSGTPSDEEALTDGPPPLSILLLSDGANTDGRYEPLEAAAIAAEFGIPVFAVALGTPEGTVRNVDVMGNVQTVHVPPDRETLKLIAERTGGQYFEAPTAEELENVYREIGSRVGFVTEVRDLGYLFAGGAGVLILAGAVLSAFWFNRFP
ncbi:MAG: VWA domain-containing protein [Acidimicrobiia bacterium]